MEPKYIDNDGQIVYIGIDGLKYPTLEEKEEADREYLESMKNLDEENKINKEISELQELKEEFLSNENENVKQK